ncbi:MAG: hypothetical protein ACT4P4_10715 [Betaproteobacteria bacterium]
MKRLIIIPLACVAFAAQAQLKAPAQKAPAQSAKSSSQAASATENETVMAIANCLVAGLPEDWSVAAMEINLEKPFDTTGDVRYFVARGSETKPAEPFTPCDVAQPARTLIEARETQPKERQGWIGARVTVFRDGKFGIRYGYPK